MDQGEERHVQFVTERLAHQFDRSPDEVESRVRAAYGEWEGARVRAFVAIMVERTVRRELKEQAPHNNR